MQDAQVPTDPDDGATDPPRRASLRLRDAEAVASVRRDMFGDGSLLDALGGAAPAPADADSSPAAAPQDGDLEPPAQPTESAAPIPLIPIPLTPIPLTPAPPTDGAQSLDAIIDAFSAEPASGAPHQPGQDGAAKGVEASSPDVSAPPVPATPPMGISSLFDSLGSIGPRADKAQGPEEPPIPDAPALDLDMSMLERSPARSALEPESEPSVQAELDIAPPSSMPAPVVQGDEVEAESAQSVEEPPAPSAPILDLDMSMLEVRVPMRRALQPEEDAYADSAPSPGDNAVQADGTQPAEVEADDPHEIEPIESAAHSPADPDAPAQDFGEPPFADVAYVDAGSPPFVGPMAPRQFPEYVDAAGVAPYPEDPPLFPDFADPPDAAGPPPFIEPLVRSPRAESTPGFPQSFTAPTFGGLSEPANTGGFPEPLVMPADLEPAETAAAPMLDAASKIEAEALATADALDNLKRLLEPTTTHDLHEPLEPPGHAAGSMRLNLHGDPTPFPPAAAPALIPMPVPLPPEPRRISGIYVLGFLTGLGLSVMAGIALYVLINLL
jgi:hypothetical protein